MPADRLQTTISRTDLESWGAFDLYSSDHVDRWLGSRDTVTVAEVLEGRTDASRLLWTVMRAELLEPRLLIQCAVDLANRHLEQVDDVGTYVDLRSRAAPAAVQQWLDGDCSLGAVMYARRRAEAARDLVAELDDSLAHATAQILVVVTDQEDAAWTFRQMFYLHRDAFTGRATDRAVLELVRERVATW